MDLANNNYDENELLLLDKILSEPDPKHKTPKLVEDKSFIDTFSYDIETITSKAHTSVVPREEVDSSDDEEVKNFLERKFNEYGSDINKKLKQQVNIRHENKVEFEVKSALKVAQYSPNCTNGGNESKNMNHELSNTPLKKLTQTQLSAHTCTVFTDPIFGLRIIKPLISSTVLIERMTGRKSVSFAEISFHIQRGDLSKDWVIAGVIVSKSPVRQTKMGQSFSIWRLSDLRGEMKMISLFLFKSAHRDLWKTAMGMCIAILNPSILEKRAEAGDAACLSIDTANKVLILGQSKDMGVCKARKKDGTSCTAVVNLYECDYCIYHIKQEYTKMAKRSELQSETIGRGIDKLRNKILGKSEVFYGGQSFTAIPAKKSSKLINRDNDRMMTLAGPSKSYCLTNDKQSEKKPVSYVSRDGPISRMANNIDSSSKQRQKDVQRLKILQADNNSVAPSCSSNLISQASAPDKFKNRQFSQGIKTLKSFDDIEINIVNRHSHNQLSKLKAVDIVKKSPIHKSDPNSLRGSKEGKRRAIDDLHEASELKRHKLDCTEHEKKSRIQRIIDATSSHQNLIDMREQQEEDQYFNKLEKKEALEEKLLNTYKVPCKAVICSDCNYTAFSATERCKQEKHRIKVVDAEKRFFQCKDCSNRTVTVFRFPKMSCKNCSGSRWERAAVIRGSKVVQEVLSIRGNEETFIGTLAGAANLNLLVPEE